LLIGETVCRLSPEQRTGQRIGFSALNIVNRVLLARKRRFAPLAPRRGGAPRDLVHLCPSRKESSNTGSILPPTLPHRPPHTHRTHPLRHSRTLALSHFTLLLLVYVQAIVSETHSLTHSPSPSPSLARSLTHSLTITITITRSLTHSLTLVLP
jgi:hypothetical protein